MFSGLVPADQISGRLFDSEMLEKYRRVMPAVDRLNAKYGPGTVRFAVARAGGRAGKRSWPGALRATRPASQR